MDHPDKTRNGGINFFYNKMLSRWNLKMQYDSDPIFCVNISFKICFMNLCSLFLYQNF